MRSAASLLFALSLSTALAAQSLPGTLGETLTGKRVVVAQAVQGHSVILVAGFSHEAGQRCTPWMQAIAKDPALSGVPAYELAMLARAPGFLRGAIKSAMRRSVAPADQGRFVVLTQDEKQWRDYFAVSAQDDPYVVVLDATGKKLWSGHGAAQDLEPQLRAALK